MQRLNKNLKWMLPLTLFTLIYFCTNSLFSQNGDDKVIQFSGLVTTEDTSSPIPYSTVREITTNRGTIANLQGFYSFVVKAGDTVEFSAVGFKPQRYIIPENIRSDSYTHIQPMPEDTLVFEETVIFPWQNLDEFRHAFVNAEIPDDYYEVARRNLQEAQLASLRSAMAMDADEAQSYSLRLAANEFRYAGYQTNYVQATPGSTPIPSSLLNPFAWAELINAIRDGKFSRDR